MSAPTYPGYLPPPPTPPTPQYPGQPSYPAAPGQLPQYPQQGYPQPQYPPQQFAPQYPQSQGYPAPQMAPPAQPLAQGSLDDFFNQPSAGGGKSLAFKAIGTRYIGIITRPLGTGDVQQQTDVQGRPQFFKDGRPKFVMKVPLQMQPSPEYPDGLATWFVKGQARDELVRAMGEAGAPAGPPEAGAIVDITFVSERQAGAGMNPAKQFVVAYRRPEGAAPAASAAPVHQAAPQPPAAPAVPVQQPDPAMQAAMANVAQQLGPTTPVVPTQQPAVLPPAQPVATSDLSVEQQQLLARLTGAQG